MEGRRTFIKKSCTLCAGILGLGAILSELSACSPMPVFQSEISRNMLSVPVSSFSGTNTMIIVRNGNLAFDILLIKKGDASFSALELKCSHQDNALTATKTGLFCASHGSTFDLEGNVTKEPAIAPLKKFKTQTDNSIIQILL